MKKTVLASLLALIFPCAELHAADSRTVNTPQGDPIFRVDFFDPGDRQFFDGFETNPAMSSTWQLPADKRDNIMAGIRYWAEILQPQVGRLPGIINVGTFDIENASAGSPPSSSGGMSLLQTVLLGKDPGPLNAGAHAIIVIGKIDFAAQPYQPSQLPTTGKFDLPATIVHEMAHALGLGTQIEDRAGKDSATPYVPRLTSWNEHLRDDSGNPMRQGQNVLCQHCNNPVNGQGFDIRQDRGYFAGEQVSAVLAGAMPGIPVRMNNVLGDMDSDYLSHSELKNSLMSHQYYRNYTTFMEAELAALQDMGYSIDRRNFFGFSVYGDGQELVNTHGYFARNAAGSDYLPGQYNTATLGLGLHVYGSHNHITQQADLLTRGAGGAGIRVDGAGNTLSVAPGTRVYADGLNGRGVMFAYGKNHNFIQRGDVQALGEHGIAASFDFGNNMMGNDSEVRGSYFVPHHGEQYEAYDRATTEELNGALVDHADISGRLAGREAAIYLSPNALVNQINILQGAQLQGDIVSRYAQKDAAGQLRLTQLSFGKQADAQGRATEAADANFRLRYDGTISGDNLALITHGGFTALNGQHQLYSVEVGAGSTLTGNSRYTLNPAAPFVNHGTLAPGASIGQIEIQGDYQQGPQGQLLLEVDGQRAQDHLRVSGKATLDGALHFVPLPDWYASDWQMDASVLDGASTVNGGFKTVDGRLVSPTLSLQTTALDAQHVRLRMQRADDAYRRLGDDDTTRQVGTALAQAATQAKPALQPLFRALDFSAADGSQVRDALHQLSPAGYSALSAAALYREQQLSTLVDARGFSAAAATGDEWRSFVTPFGGQSKQNRQDGAVGYQASGQGALFGVEKQLDGPRGSWLLGVHGALGEQTVKVQAPDSGNGKSRTAELGVHARYAADPQQGSYLFGSARLGSASGSMQRDVRVGAFSASQHADWNGLLGALSAGGGYRWALNRNLNLGLLSALDYSTLSRPALSESGGAAALQLDAARAQSLRSRLGVDAALQTELNSGARVGAELQLVWVHELLNTATTQNAGLLDYANARMTSRQAAPGRDALTVTAGLRYQAQKNLELGINLSSDLLRPGFDSLSGSASATWRF